jgi:SAM-dependent methyltransferase
MAYWDQLEKHTDWDEIWMSHPLVRARINQRVSGDPGLWPLLWFRNVMGNRSPFDHALSIGCGVGNLERSLVEHGIVSTVTGVDVSATAISEAQRRAAEAGFADRIRYEVADSRSFLVEQRDVDAVFFHASLHHFSDLSAFLRDVWSALRPGGILYIDEYVGPARTEWSLKRMAVLNAVYRLLPRDIRRVRVIHRPVNRDDPTEAVESSGIHAAVQQSFQVLHRRDYGGNLLAVLYPALRRPTSSQDPLATAFHEAVELLLDLEDVVLRHGGLLRETSFNSVVVAGKQ